MRTKVIIRGFVAIAMTAALVTSTGCKSKKGASSGSCGQIEMDTRHNQDKRTTDS